MHPENLGGPLGGDPLFYALQPRAGLMEILYIQPYADVPAAAQQR